MKSLERLLHKLPLAIGLASGLVLVVVMGRASFAGDSEALAGSAATAAACAGLVLSLALYLAGLLQRPVRSFRYWGLVLLHAGLAAVFSGLALNEVAGSRGFVFLPEKGSTHYFVGYDEKDYPLPFEITLKDFAVHAYPGTMRVRDYVSRVAIDGKECTIAVNAPVKAAGFELFQHDCGFEAAPGHPFAVRLRLDGAERTVEVRMGEPFLVGSRFLAVVRDFLPSASKMDGSSALEPQRPAVMTTGRDMILNPAFLIELEDDFGGRFAQWVFPEEPESAVFLVPNPVSAGDPARVEILPQAFPGIEYTVLSVVHTPFNHLVFAGVVLACAGMVLFYVLGRRRK